MEADSSNSWPEVLKPYEAPSLKGGTVLVRMVQDKPPKELQDVTGIGGTRLMRNEEGAAQWSAQLPIDSTGFLSTELGSTQSTTSLRPNKARALLVHPGRVECEERNHGPSRSLCLIIHVAACALARNTRQRTTNNQQAQPGGNESRKESNENSMIRDSDLRIGGPMARWVLTDGFLLLILIAVSPRGRSRSGRQLLFKDISRLGLQEPRRR